MRVVFFIVVVCFVLYKMREDAIWSTAMGVFVYFAIPSREFFMPTLPYQPLFFFSAILLSIRTRKVFNDGVKREVRKESQLAAASVYEAMRTEFAATIAKAILSGRSTSEAKVEALALAETRVTELRLSMIPAKLEGIVRALLMSRLEVGAEAGAKEAERMLGFYKGVPPRNYVATLTERVLMVVETNVSVALEAELDKFIGAADSAHERATRLNQPGNFGFLGIPLPITGLAAIFTNVGFWFHLAFTAATWFCSQHARYSYEIAIAQVDTCVLLLIPMCAILLTIRTAEQFRIFLWAWMFGVMLLCYNGITDWLAHGGRADNVGGQANDANWLGIIAVTIAPLCFSIITGERKFLVRCFGLFGAGTCAVGIIACGSRGALIALCIGVAYWFIWTGKKGIALSILLCGGAAFLVVAPNEFWERMGTIFLKENNPWILVQRESSAETRKRFWATAIDVIKDVPWTGVGPRNFPKEIGARGVMLEFGLGSMEMECHNTWLHLLAEYGIWGSIWMIAHLVSFSMIFRAMVMTRKLRSDPRFSWLTSYMVGLQAGWLAGWVAMSFVSSQWYDFNFWIFVIGPLALQIARHTLTYKEWFSLPLPTTDLPPPRYGPPVPGKLDLGHIDVSAYPVLRAP